MASQNLYSWCLVAPGACIFIVRDNTLITPPTTSSILESITRSTVIQIAEKLDLKVKEDEIDRTELYVSDEIFLCGTAMEITPVFSVDRVPIGEERIGPWGESGIHDGDATQAAEAVQKAPRIRSRRQGMHRRKSLTFLRFAFVLDLGQDGILGIGRATLYSKLEEMGQ